MKIKSLTVAALTSLISFSALAESLKCTEVISFRQADMFINRDGAIGFNGTYITIDASWFFQAGFNSVNQLTGRASDENLAPIALGLYLSPKGSCTNNNDSLSEDFSCSVKQGEIDVTGKDFQTVSDASIVSSESISKKLRLKVDVELDAKIKIIDSKKRSILLTGLITNAKTGQSVELHESMECTVE